MTEAAVEVEVVPTREERLLATIIADVQFGDIHRALQAIAGYRFDVQHEDTDPKVTRVVTEEWGVRHSPGKGWLTVRWNPTFGGAREPEPYTEAEARGDSARSGYPVVRRTRVTYEFEDEVTDWEPADE